MKSKVNTIPLQVESPYNDIEVASYTVILNDIVSILKEDNPDTKTVNHALEQIRALVLHIRDRLDRDETIGGSLESLLQHVKQIQ